eukprot:TRINITY_DN3078_c0_g1_i1.p1 TRINITY_DN3078_c0_g1~~TRINITY_DN3078_c0_g1_i1.p1  ORF type:complete len:299 (-),score=39.61 TRINITY_DN3078_c0_g1_i1:242-1138(-)
MDLIVARIRPAFQNSTRSITNVELSDAVAHLATSYFVYGIGGALLYLIISSISFYISFIKGKEKNFPTASHLPPKDVLYAQVYEEISVSLSSIPIMALLTVPFNMMSFWGWSKTYNEVSEYGWAYFFASIFMFICFSDMCIYWIHLFLHWGPVYKAIHKRHHGFRFTTPFSSHAFHPVDGWVQSVPYHVFGFLFPIHGVLLLFLFIGVNIWSISIHDRVPVYKGQWINSGACHDLHHREFAYNYGQYFTLWDRLNNTYKDPSYLIDDGSIPPKMMQAEIAKFRSKTKLKSDDDLQRSG